MTHWTKVLSALALAVALLLGIALWQVLIEPPAAPPAQQAAERGAPPTVTASLPGDGERTEAEGARQVVPSPPAAEGTGDGSILVKATYEEDGSPVPGLTIMVRRPGADHRISVRRAPTDAKGVVRFTGLGSGRWWVANNHNSDGLERTEVHAGKETLVELVLPVGIRITGVVVDRDGTPVAGAQVLLAPMAHADRDVEHVADTGPDGRFALRSCPKLSLVGARAHGHAPSRLQFLYLQEGDSKEVRIVLPGPGGTVEGTVFGPDGTPVSTAIVRIGEGQVSGIAAGSNGAPAPAALARTGTDGRFRAVGLAAGEQPVQVRAAGLAPWTGTCSVAEHMVVPLQVTLGPGMSCTGVVLGAGEAPVAKASVEVGGWQDFAHYRTLSAADGSFRLDGLLPGEVVVRARNDSGKTEEVVRGGPGDTVTCELHLASGLVFKGRVVTETGEPVQDWAILQVYAERREGKPFWATHGRVGEDGRFAIPNCPEGRLLTVAVRGSRIRERRFEGIDPRDGEREFRVQSTPAASARLVGKVVDPDGLPVTQATISARDESGESTGLGALSAEGTFDLGPLRPGSWRVSVRAEGHPYLVTEPWPVAADAVVDVGTLWLPPSGRIRARVKNEHGLKPTLSVGNEDMTHWSGLLGDGVERVSEPLAPGQYSVSVLGRGIASEFWPVTVRVGEDSLLDITVEPGQRQRFTWTAPAPLGELQLQVLRGGTVVARTRYRARGSWPVPAEWERSLVRGDYVLEARGDGLSARVPFTVGAGKDDPVQFALR